MALETIRIRVVNWEKHNPGRNGKKLPWFKMSTGYIFDEKIRGLTIVQKHVFICLLCICSDKGRDDFEISVSNLKSLLHMPGANLDRTLSKLRDNLLITLNEPLTNLSQTSTQPLTNLGLQLNENVKENISHLYREDKRREDNISLRVIGVDTNLKKALGEWGTTLDRFGIKKDPSFDEVAIQRLIVRYGFDQTLLALRGARLEAKTESYDPAKHCSISRISRPAVFDKFVNLGSQEADSESRFERETVHASD